MNNGWGTISFAWLEANFDQEEPDRFCKVPSLVKLLNDDAPAYKRFPNRQKYTKDNIEDWAILLDNINALFRIHIVKDYHGAPSKSPQVDVSKFKFKLPAHKVVKRLVNHVLTSVEIPAFDLAAYDAIPGRPMSDLKPWSMIRDKADKQKGILEGGVSYGISAPFKVSYKFKEITDVERANALKGSPVVEDASEDDLDGEDDPEDAPLDASVGSKRKAEDVVEDEADDDE